jgi:hypothetical protein
MLGELGLGRYDILPRSHGTQYAALSRVLHPI